MTKVYNPSTTFPKSRSRPDANNKTNTNSAGSFQAAMTSTLTVARVLGLFPVEGLASGSAHRLRFRQFSVVAFMSAVTVVTLVWAAILSLYHTAYSLVRATEGKSGGFANATAGGIFYTNAALAAVILRGIARGWPRVISHWELQERKIDPHRPRLRALLRAVALVVLVLAMTEHLLSIFNNVPDCRAGWSTGNATLRECLKEYCLRSHSFIFDSVPYSVPLGIFIFYISKSATFAWNFQDLFLMQVCLAMVSHFRQINKLITRVDVQKSSVADWKRIRDIYVGCVSLNRGLSRLVASLVLLSFGNNLYFICLQMLNGLAPTLQGTLQNVYFFGSFGFMVSRLIFVTMIAASIPLEAQRALPFLRCCPSSAYCVEVERLSYQIAHDEVALTGLGFFTVNRSFILGLAGAIATYEVVLLQFDTGQSEAPTVAPN